MLFSEVVNDFEMVIGRGKFSGDTAIVRRGTAQILWVEFSPELAVAICDAVNNNVLFITTVNRDDYLEQEGLRLRLPDNEDSNDPKELSWLVSGLTAERSWAIKGF